MRSENKNESEIIVVASLLEKMPNLANLTRTSEVFGVSELILNNRNIINDSNFKSVSVTAEKWIPIVEIKEKDLIEFLFFKKKLGYKVNLLIFF